MEKPEPSKPAYYANIPANVRYDFELSPNAKLLYGEITALCNKEGYCWSTNEYFADLYQVSKTSVSKWISSLIDRGYIKSQLIYKEGTKEILHRYLSLVIHPPKEKFNTPPQQKEYPPIEEKLKDNTTSFNTTNDNITVNKILYADFIYIINLILQREFKGTDSSKKSFAARLREGYKLADFRKAIQNASLDPWHIQSGYKWLDPDFFTNQKKLERFRQEVITPVSPEQKTNFDRFTEVSNQISERINSIPDEVYNQYKQQYQPSALG